MHRWVRLKLEMGSRMLAFCREHPSRNTGIERVVAELAWQIVRANTLAAQTVEAHLGALAATRQRAHLRQRIRAGYLIPVTQIVRSVAEKERELVTPWPLPRFRANDNTFAVTVRGAAQEVRRLPELFARNALRPEVIDEMMALLDKWEEAGRRQTEFRLRKIAARAGLEAAAEKILEIAQLLDAVYPLHFAGDPALAAERTSARRIPWPRTRQLTTNNQRLAVADG
jgi:hypothetical protein